LRENSSYNSVWEVYASICEKTSDEATEGMGVGRGTLFTHKRERQRVNLFRCQRAFSIRLII